MGYNLDAFGQEFFGDVGIVWNEGGEGCASLCQMTINNIAANGDIGDFAFLDACDEIAKRHGGLVREIAIRLEHVDQRDQREADDGQQQDIFPKIIQSFSLSGENQLGIGMI